MDLATEVFPRARKFDLDSHKPEKLSRTYTGIKLDEEYDVVANALPMIGSLFDRILEFIL